MFYVLLTLFMPFRELYLMIRGRSSAKRWKFIAVQMGLVVGIAGGMWGEAWLLTRLFAWISSLGKTAGGVQHALAQAKVMTYVIPGGAVVCLVMVVVLFYGLKLMVKAGRKTSNVPAPRPRVALQREAA